MDSHPDHPKDSVYHILVICLLMLFPAHAFSRMLDGWGVELLALVNVVTLLGCVVAMSRGKLRIVALVLSLLTLWVVLAPDQGSLFVLGGDAFALVVYAYVIYVLLQRVFSAHRLSGADISATMAIYLLLGLIWAKIYGIVYAFAPAAFRGPEGLSEAHIESALFYFSFVTLSTLGYGDISPVTPIAMSLTTLEAIVGQLFLVVGVATVVSAVSSQKSDS